jgi:predicted nucleotidyltransferase
MIPYESWQARTADADLLQRCKKAIRAVVPDADVILYGSRARGDAKDDSDYDLLVLVDRPADVTVHQQLIARISPLEGDGAVLTLRACKEIKYTISASVEWHSSIPHGRHLE